MMDPVSKKSNKNHKLPWISWWSQRGFSRGASHKGAGSHTWSSGFRGGQMRPPPTPTPSWRWIRTVRTVSVQTFQFPAALGGRSSVRTDWSCSIFSICCLIYWNRAPSRPPIPLRPHTTPTPLRGSIVNNFISIFSHLIQSWTCALYWIFC